MTSVPIQLKRKCCGGCTSIVHVARWFFAFPIKANMLTPFFSAKSYKARKQSPAPLGYASVAWSVSQDSARKSVSKKGASPAVIPSRTNLMMPNLVF